MDFLDRLPFRLGTTSYILPDEILPNARYLAGQVRDIELVLFEVDEAQNNLPSSETVEQLQELARIHDLTYTVHLPLDLRLGAEGDERHPSILKARRTIAATRRLSPRAYIVHLDGREIRDNPSKEARTRWSEQARGALEIIAGEAGDLQQLAVENLEGYPLEIWDTVLEALPASRCVDVGHLWLDGYDPLPFLRRVLTRTRVVHLHGINQRDHASVAWVAEEQLDAVLAFLLQQQYSGIVTLEVFGQEDFLSSMNAVQMGLQRAGW